MHCNVCERLFGNEIKQGVATTCFQTEKVSPPTVIDFSPLWQVYTACIDSKMRQSVGDEVHDVRDSPEDEFSMSGQGEDGMQLSRMQYRA